MKKNISTIFVGQINEINGNENGAPGLEIRVIILSFIFDMFTI